VISFRPLLAGLVAAAVVLALSTIASGSTRVYNSYAGPKTWLQGWDASGPFDSWDARWWYNEMTPSCYCLARVAWIDGSGNWRESNSWADRTVWTFAPIEVDRRFKPYCKNNSAVVYTAACNVTT
jgi:hypothetical protein